MENEENNTPEVGFPRVVLTDGEKIEYLDQINRQLIKLLVQIEKERDGTDTAKLFFGNLLFDISSFDAMFDNRLAPVLVKLHGLYNENAYLTLSHTVVKRKIFESRGIIAGLVKEINDQPSQSKNRKEHSSGNKKISNGGTASKR